MSIKYLSVCKSQLERLNFVTPIVSQSCGYFCLHGFHIRPSTCIMNNKPHRCVSHRSKLKAGATRKTVCDVDLTIHAALYNDEM